MVAEATLLMGGGETQDQRPLRPRIVGGALIRRPFHNLKLGQRFATVAHRRANAVSTGVSATDDEALKAFQLCSRLEGIIPALEPAHALAHVAKIAGDLPKDHLMVMNMCGRGDKDVFAVARLLGIEVSQ